ncbi:MAG: hypothetical protein AB7U82_34010 [Blastocatellales bacterium]
MRQRPIRSQLYLPILRFGITDDDWGIVIIASVTGYAAPFALGLEFYHLPAELIGWVVMMGMSILALNIIRRKSRPGWVKHILRAKLRGKVHRRWLPGECQPEWLVVNRKLAIATKESLRGISYQQPA